MRKKTVAIIILTKNRNDLLFDCVDSIIQNGTGCIDNINYRILVVDTGSNAKNINNMVNRYAKYSRYGDNNLVVDFLLLNRYNFAANNDMAINHLMANNFISVDSNDLILFCNNDIIIPDKENTIDKMVLEYYSLEEKKINVGTLGTMLLYPDNNTIQHAGIYLEKDGNDYIITHKGLRQKVAPGHRLNTLNTIGCTGALLLVSLRKYLGNRFRPTKECFEDLLLNIDLKLAGHSNVYLGSTYAYHKESQTRRENKEMYKHTGEDYVKHVKPLLDNYWPFLRTCIEN